MSLPPGFRLALDPGLRRIDGGSVLVGGSPLRLLRLTPAGSRVVDELAAGGEVPSGRAAQRLARRLLTTAMAQPRPPPGPYTPADVTLVVPVRDVPLRVPVEHAIVVDDGSQTPVAGAVRHDHARGPAAARNTGWRRASTALVAFVDADCELPDRWVDGLLPHFADPLVGAVAPRIRSTGTGVIGAYEAARSSLDRGPQEGTVRPRSRIPFVPTAALVVRRSLLEELGGFDESLRFGEDVDLVWRIVERGLVVRYEPSVTVGHPARPTFGAWLRQRYDYGSSAAPLGRRHPGSVAPLVVSHWSATAWLLTALGWPLLGTGVAATTTALLAPRLRGLRHPWQEAARLAGIGHLRAGAQVADAVRRTWWPLAVVAAIVSRRARRAALLAALPALRNPLRLVDDVAYGAGVWAGCIRERSFAALVPDLASWPGRAQALEIAAAAETISSTQVSGGITIESILR